MPFKVANAVLFFGIFPVVAYFLLVGGFFGLPYVETRSWGGLLVTLVVAVTGISASLPLGILLALARRSPTNHDRQTFDNSAANGLRVPSH